MEAGHRDDRAVLTGLLASRWSCRAFRPDPVPRPTILAMLAAAQATASWCNVQPWHTTVVAGAATGRLCAALLDAAARNAPDEPDLPFPAAYEGVLRERRLDAAVRLYGALGIARADRAGAAAQAMENFRLFGAPHAFIVTSPRALGAYGAVDCGGFIATLMLAARAHGVDTVAQASLARYPAVLRRELGLPEDRLVVCGVSFGYADAAHPANTVRTPRAGDGVSWVE